jgi:superfamily II DNA or RNA helicase
MNEDFFKTIQGLCGRQLWSNAVEMTRSSDIVQDKVTPNEIVVRIVNRSKAVSPKVILWPEDEDWKCDCRGEEDPCVHVAAAVIASRHGKVRSPERELKSSAGQVQYHFVSDQQVLKFERRLVWGAINKPLMGTLMNYVSGVTSGRLDGLPVSSTKEDFHIDTVLGEKRVGTLDAATLSKLFAALAEFTSVYLDGVPVKTFPKPVEIFVEVIDERNGFRIRKKEESGFDRFFLNGAVLIDGVLKAIPQFNLEPEHIEMLKGDGRWFNETDRFFLMQNVLPALTSRIKVVVHTTRLPEIVDVEPEIILKIERHGPELMVVTPQLVYGDPPMAFVNQGKLEPISDNRVPVRKRDAEQRITKRLHQEMFMKPGSPVRFFGPEGIALREKLKNWKTTGSAQNDFIVRGQLIADTIIQGEHVDVSFSLGGNTKGDTKVSSQRILAAWNNGERHIHIDGFGWYELPNDWLARFGEKLQQIIAFKREASLSPVKKIQVIDFLQELEAEIPPDLQGLRSLMQDDQLIPEAPLPKDLTVQLRDYQKVGINWLHALTTNGLGALLADDMGLGKTLQSLCVLEGQTLIVCPTSVIQSWTEQIKRFRPSLTVCTYHGPKRQFDEKASVVLTSYGIFRTEIEKMKNMIWQTIIVDEAQHFKNPESLLSRALYQITAPRRITLSGTPIENSADDLWAQFRFLNPGLLPPYSTFRKEFTNPSEEGDKTATERLRKRIRPFVLRRMKSEVAKELPPKTEIVLNFELGEQERELYEALRQSARTEVMEKINEGGSLFSALELLLRLRQACCHQQLVPGQRGADSTKTELLVEKLEESVASGHKALVFSQWTSYLDLIEPFLKEKGLNFVRLDGSTRDRQSVVTEFQRDDGPSVFLISLKAGGVGLTLTQADHVFILDPWWNPAVEAQAADRAHRIGQTKSVFVYRLVAKDTVEEKVLRLQDKKKQQMQMILDGTENISWSKQDLLELLS